MKRDFQSFREFYPYYLGEHTGTATRRLHFVGSSLVLGCVLFSLAHGAGDTTGRGPTGSDPPGKLYAQAQPRPTLGLRLSRWRSSRAALSLLCRTVTDCDRK